MSAQISGELTLTLPEGWWLIGMQEEYERVGAVEAIVADTVPASSTIVRIPGASVRNGGGVPRRALTDRSLNV